MPDFIEGLGNISENRPRFQGLRVLKSLVNFIYKKQELICGGITRSKDWFE